MSQPSPEPSETSSAPMEAPPAQPQTEEAAAPSTVAEQPLQPKPSYVKLAMRNMVRKRGKSLFHFTLTTVGLLTVLVGLAYLTR